MKKEIAANATLIGIIGMINYCYNSNNYILMPMPGEKHKWRVRNVRTAMIDPTIYVELSKNRYRFIKED